MLSKSNGMNCQLLVAWMTELLKCKNNLYRCVERLIEQYSLQDALRLPINYYPGHRGAPTQRIQPRRRGYYLSCLANDQKQIPNMQGNRNIPR